MKKGKETTSRVNTILDSNRILENVTINLTWDKYAYNRILEKQAIQSFRIKMATIEELKALDKASVRSSLLDALEETVYLLDDVYSVSRIRTIKEHEFQEVLVIAIYDNEKDIQIFSKENTFNMEAIGVKNS